MALRVLLGLPRMGMMLLSALLLVGGAIDLAACEPEPDHHTASLIAQDDHQTETASSPDAGHSSEGEQHAVCAHGHCHHAANIILHDTAQPVPVSSAHAVHATSTHGLAPPPLTAPFQPPRA